MAGFDESKHPRNDDGRFAPTGGEISERRSEKGLDFSEDSAIIREMFDDAVKHGKISLRLDKQKQGAHVKGNPEYEKRVARGEHPSYITVSKMEIQTIINATCGTGELIMKPDGQFIETITWDTVFGVCSEKYTGKETYTNRGTIHYSKTGAHLVPSKP